MIFIRGTYINTSPVGLDMYLVVNAALIVSYGGFLKQNYIVTCIYCTPNNYNDYCATGLPLDKVFFTCFDMFSLFY